MESDPPRAGAAPDSDFPELQWEEEEAATRPLPLHEVPPVARRDRLVALIGQHHLRIASAIETMWGHAECPEYIQQLVISGYKDGEKRLGFRSEVVQALLALGDLHEQEFPMLALERTRAQQKR